jgi:hypothetical protein
MFLGSLDVRDFDLSWLLPTSRDETTQMASGLPPALLFTHSEIIL